MKAALYDLKHSKKNEKDNILLQDYSKKDRVWDEKRSLAEFLSQSLLSNVEFKKWGERILSCAPFLEMGFEVNNETGELNLKLQSANFCHVRHCPVCNWRRSLRLKARFYNFLPEFKKKNKKTRFLFLTLTVPNIPIYNLSEELDSMNQAWQRLSQRKFFKNVVNGFVRVTEVTREHKRNEYAHPHFHILLAVDEKYFQGKNYIARDVWLENWRECKRDFSITQVDIRAVKNNIEDDSVIEEITKTFNYSVKKEEYIEPDFWLFEYFRQVRNRRFIVAGGSLKKAIQDSRNETDDDLIFTDGDEISVKEKEEEVLFFGWQNFKFVYSRTKFN